MQHEDNIKSLETRVGLLIMPMLFVSAMIALVALLSLI